jgi:FlaA1/EpsC-like NDP-sugar epimerase
MGKLLNKISNWYFSKNALPYWVVLAIDCLIVLFSGIIAILITFGGHFFRVNLWPISLGLLLTLILFVIPFRLFKTYTGIIRYSSFVDLQRVTVATLIGSLLTFLASAIVSSIGNGKIIMFTLNGIIILFAFTTILMLLVRVSVKQLFDLFRKDANTQKVIIYGVKEGGVALAKGIRNATPVKFSLAGFLSPDDDIKAEFLMGVEVRPIRPDTADKMKAIGANIILVSSTHIDSFREQTELINNLINNGIKIMFMPHAEEWDGKTDIEQKLREVDIEDLLPRKKIEVNMDAIGELLKDKRILITGAAGSIGSEMVRQVAVFNPAEMILIDQAETPMHNIRLMMARDFADIKAETIVANITNKEHMDKIFSEHKPEYVFHAAAYKHVPLMEDNPAMAVQNNIYGTRVIADLAVKYGTKKFVMISTDKAVNPTNVMGCSKRICEIYCQSLNNAIASGEVNGVTQFVTTRFGNVLGSNGSVIPLFREQIKRGGPVTVTHPDILRFFMLITEACKLVLEAGTTGKGGEIFVFDMGEPVKIVDLAKRMIALSDASNVQIEFTGLRDGEKLYEEVLSKQENTKPTSHPKILVASVREYDYKTACSNEQRLLNASYTFDDMAIVKIMKEIVPEYKSRQSKFTALD